MFPREWELQPSWINVADIFLWRSERFNLPPSSSGFWISAFVLVFLWTRDLPVDSSFFKQPCYSNFQRSSKANINTTKRWGGIFQVFHEEEHSGSEHMNSSRREWWFYNAAPTAQMPKGGKLEMCEGKLTGKWVYPLAPRTCKCHGSRTDYEHLDSC